MPSSPPAASDGIARASAGIWSLSGERLVSIQSFDVGLSIVLVPTESVLLTTAELPLPGLRRRAETLPFAIEDMIGEPIAAAHFALGAETAPQRHIGGVVSHEIMRAWVNRLAEAGLERAAIVPDALALPLPVADAWSVDLANGRALVRTADGAGFALPAENLEGAWQAAGRPACVAYGARLPEAMGASSADLEVEPLATRLTAPALDLRQGFYTRTRRGLPRLARRVALVAAVGLVAHAAIAAAGIVALDHIAAARAAEVRALATQAAPGTVIGDDLATGVVDILPAAGSGASVFLPLLTRITKALKPVGTVSFRSLSFDGAAGTVSIEVEATDIAGLQRVGQALQSDGLSADSGGASADQGKAVGSFLIRNTR